MSPFAFESYTNGLLLRLQDIDQEAASIARRRRDVLIELAERGISAGDDDAD